MNKTCICLVAVLLPLTIVAGSRSSAAYGVAADALDAGGRRTASANYSNDGSIGGIGGVSSGGAPVRLAKHSYIGQLFDVVALTLAATPATINEGTTRQLAASATADDGSITAVGAAQVSWSIIDGPITSISPEGLATAAIVYQNTPATVGGASQGASATLALTVLNVGIDDYRTYAGDNIDDAWQVGFFGEDNPNAGAGEDPDFDGQNNYFEYFANTTPTDARSKFDLAIATVIGQPNQKDIIFSPRFPSRSYAVQFRLDLVDSSSWANLGGATTNDVSTTRTVRDLNAGGLSKFYRVGISFP